MSSPTGKGSPWSGGARPTPAADCRPSGRPHWPRCAAAYSKGCSTRPSTAWRHAVSPAVPLTELQLVQGATADVVTVLHTAAAARPDTAPEAVAALHEQLTDAGWTVARFFGAEGYLATHPARALHLSALTADVWVPRTTSREGRG